MKTTKKALIMAGGTGGHVFPGIAVAKYLIKQGWDVRWLGTSDRMEAELVPANGIDIDFIKISGLRGKGFWALSKAPLQIFKAVMQARRILKSYQPDVVLGMGGYVSGPGGMAARSLNIPIVLHEQNGVAGLTNKWLAKIASAVLQAFPSAFPAAQVVGNPVRDDLLQLAAPQMRFKERQGPIRILVMGGSQGAKIINQTVPQVIKQLADKCAVYHQTGKGMLDMVTDAYQGCDMTHHRVEAFITDIASAYNWADLVICRSGALTVSEIQAVGLSAIFIPFMHKDRQQYWNAKGLEDIGAATIIEQPNFSANALFDLLDNLDRKSLCDMAIKAKTLAIEDATQKVVDVLASFVKSQ